MLRIGQGFDLHKLVEGRKLILGGVCIPHSLGLLGHSDADVLIHSIIDAILGALALGDIGQVFPDTDNRFKDVSSCYLLRYIKDNFLTTSGYSILNIDSTIIIETPKLMKYIQLMRKNIADDLCIPIDSISIKAKTSEKIGIVGRGEAVISQAVVLIHK